MAAIDIIYLAILVLLILFSAFFSATDMAYSTVKLNRLRTKAESGNHGARRTLTLAENYDKTIANILLGNDFVNLLASSLASLLAKDLLEPVIKESASTVMSGILLVTLLIFGEILPKAIAKNHSYQFSVLSQPLLSILNILFYPIVRPITALTGWLTKRLADKTGGETAVASDDELEAMVDQIQSEGIIDDDQSELLKKSIDFKETSCYEVMTPRIHVRGYDIETPFSDFLKEENCFLHSRILVYKRDLDHVLGYVQAKTLLKILVQGREVDIARLTFPIVSVPRTMMISQAMAIMKKSHHHILLVRDEYGGTDGILTMEDILEELVGELWDEDEKPEQFITKLKDGNTYLVHGNVNIDDFMNTFHLDPDELDDVYATLSGFVTQRLERFPKVGDVINYKTLDIQVLRTDGCLMDLALVTYHPEEADGGADDE